jgi:hypothetical protein
MSDVNLLTFKSHYPIVTFYIYKYDVVVFSPSRRNSVCNPQIKDEVKKKN